MRSLPRARGDMGGPRRMALRDFQRKLGPVNYLTFDGFAGVYFVESKVPLNNSFAC